MSRFPTIEEVLDAMSPADRKEFRAGRMSGEKLEGIASRKGKHEKSSKGRSIPLNRAVFMHATECEAWESGGLTDEQHDAMLKRLEARTFDDYMAARPHVDTQTDVI